MLDSCDILMTLLTWIFWHHSPDQSVEGLEDICNKGCSGSPCSWQMTEFEWCNQTALLQEWNNFPWFSILNRNKINDWDYNCKILTVPGHFLSWHRTVSTKIFSSISSPWSFVQYLPPKLRWHFFFLMVWLWPQVRLLFPTLSIPLQSSVISQSVHSPCLTGVSGHRTTLSSWLFLSISLSTLRHRWDLSSTHFEQNLLSFFIRLQ